MNMRLRCPRLSLTIKFLALLFAMAATIEAASLHVAGRGDDGNPGTRREPFKTLPKALAAVSERDWTSGDLVIYVDPGIYWNAETLVLDNSVSGPADGELVIRSAGGPGAARFIGGEPTGPWQLHEGEVWKTPMPSGRVFHVLYENGRLCHKARFPNHGEEPRFPVYSGDYLLADWHPGIRYRSGDFDPAGWDLSQAELVISPQRNKDWDLLTLPIVGIDPATRTIFTKQMSREDPDFGTAPVWDPPPDAATPSSRSRYFIQNVPQLLDAPGEFYHDKNQGILYFWPRDGDPNDSEVIAPKMKTLLLLDGARNIRFEGLRFEAGDFTDYYRMFDATVYRTGLVTLTNTRNIEFRNCHFLNAGYTALLMFNNNSDNAVYGSLFENAAGGIWANTTTGAAFNRNHRFINNLFLSMGRNAYSPGVGVKLHESSNSLVAHCHVKGAARWGFSIRGRANNRTNNHGVPGDNVVRHSVVERAVQDSGDAGALHFANVSLNVEPYRVNTYRQIIVMDTRGHPSIQDDWLPAGVFVDFESFGQRFEDVLVLDTESGDPYRENPVQGPNPPGLTTDASLENVSWLEDFDPARMEFDLIGLLPDFPAEFLVRIRDRFRQKMEFLVEGLLEGQQGWNSVAFISPEVVRLVVGVGETFWLGPNTAAASGNVRASKEMSRGLGLTRSATVSVSFDFIQMADGNLPGFGIGSSSRVPAHIALANGTLQVRAEGFGQQQVARRADGTPFVFVQGIPYRVRSEWRLGEAEGGRATLLVQRAGIGEAGFEPLYFDGGSGSMVDTACLGIETDPEHWDLLWLRLGFGSQQTYLANMAVSVHEPVPPKSPYRAWAETQFDQQELDDPAVSGLFARPAGSGSANAFRFLFQLDRFHGAARISPVFLQSDEGLRVEYFRPSPNSEAFVELQVSRDLINWANALENGWEVDAIQDLTDSQRVILQIGPQDAGNGPFLFRHRAVRN